jgi:hypothetical protein
MPLSKIKTNSIATGNITGAQLSSNVDLTGKIITSPTIEGNTTIDSGTLFVDSINNRIGINTITPDYRLTVAGTVNSTQLQNKNSFADSYQNLNKYYMGKQHVGSVSVPNNNAWTTILALGNGISPADSSTGSVYGMKDDSTSGFIQIWVDWFGAYVIGWVAFSSKGIFSFNHLNIISSYGYNAGIQISGQSIQVRNSGGNSGPVNMSFHTFG